MISEITDNKNQRGWVFFDGACRFCSALARRWSRVLNRHGFGLAPLQAPWVRETLRLAGAQLLSEMRLLTKQGVAYGGADALLQLARQIWWARPFYWISRVPGITPVLRKAYAWVARHRHCVGGACKAGRPSGRLAGETLAWVVAAMPVGSAFVLAARRPAWLWMWAIALGLFVGAKWLTVWRLLRINREEHGTGQPPGARVVAYAFLWVGMDSRSFFSSRTAPRPARTEWLMATVKTLFGTLLVWAVVPQIGAAPPLVQGWLGLVGLVLVLHFGSFHLLSLFWRARGISTPPIMQSPLSSKSLSEFWGGRWNAAFNDLMREHVFRPLSKRFGAKASLFAVFLISGLLHDLVISVPAGGGYGLPTLYFVVQAIGVWLERSRMGLRLGLASGWRGRSFVLLVSGVPAFWLFHPAFIRDVIRPMLEALGAT
jgi:predicted DCC family thiol-disulfide oxidoreductase YuxK